MILREVIRNQKDNINNMSAPVKASFAFIVCGIIQKGIGFLTTPIFTRMMSTSDYGTYSLYLSWYSIIILISSLNLTVAYNNALVKYQNQEKKVLSSFLGISTSISFLLLIVYLCNMSFWNALFGLSSRIVLLMLFQCFIEPAFQLWSARERFYYRYKKIIAYTIFIALGSPILGILLIYLPGNDAFERILANIIVVGIIYSYLFIISVINGKSFCNKEYWIFGLKMCVPLIPHFLSQIFLSQSDRIMISKMVGEDKTAIYSVAYTIAAVVSIVITSINNSLLPYVYQNLKEQNINVKNKINKLLLLVGSMCFLIMLMGPEFIQVVGGSKYSEAIWIIPSVTTATYFTFVFSNFANIELYYEKTIYMTIGSVIAAILNILLNYLLIPKFGYIVAGYTTLVGYMILSMLHYCFYKMIIKNEKWITTSIIDIGFIFLISIIMLLLMMVVVWTYNNKLIRYGFIIIIVIVFIIKRKEILNALKGRVD